MFASTPLDAGHHRTSRRLDPRRRLRNGHGIPSSVAVPIFGMVRNYLRHRADIFLMSSGERASFHTLVVRMPASGRCRVTYHFYSQGRHKDIGAVELKDLWVAHIDVGPDTWSMDCLARDTERIVLLDNRQVSGGEFPWRAELDAIHAEYLGPVSATPGEETRP